MIPTPRMKRSRGTAKRVGEGKRTKYINNNIDKFSLLQYNTIIDAYLGTVTYDDGAAEQNKKRFTGYKFTKRVSNTSTTNLNIAWNDGIFWSYQNNFRELPCTAGTLPFGGASAFCKDDQFTCNVLDGNRRIVGGSVVRKIPYNPKFAADGDASNPPYLVSGNANTNQALAKNTTIPVLGICGTNHIHQVSQKIKLKETMCTMAPENGTSGLITCTPSMQIGPLGVWEDITDDQKAMYEELAQQKLKAQIKFAVRNIIMYVPHALDYGHTQVDTAADDGYSNVKGENMVEVLNETIMSELFEMVPHVYGPGHKDNSDLKKKINPKFKVLKDWTQKYGFTGNDTPSCVNSQFYHRYDHSTPTVLCDDISAREISQDSLQTSKNCRVDMQTGISTTIYDLTRDEDYVADINDNVPTSCGGLLCLPNAGIASIEALQNRRKDGNRQNTDDTTERLILGLTGQYDQDINNLTSPIQSPLTHRLVWIRIPRFATTLELEHVNNLNTRPFRKLTDVRGIVNACGTKVQGYAQWNVLRADKSPSGGMNPPIPTQDGNTGQKYEMQTSGYMLPVNN